MNRRIRTPICKKKKKFCKKALCGRVEKIPGSCEIFFSGAKI
jgi:hypothetical protein